MCSINIPRTGVWARLRVKPFPGFESHFSSLLNQLDRNVRLSFRVKFCSVGVVYRISSTQTMRATVATKHPLNRLACRPVDRLARHPICGVRSHGYLILGILVGVGQDDNRKRTATRFKLGFFDCTNEVPRGAVLPGPIRLDTMNTVCGHLSLCWCIGQSATVAW